MSPQPHLFLYDHPMSSYAQKVRMALRHKGLTFTSQTPENLGAGHPNASFSSANLRMEVPALIINNDFKIFDSTAILAYLEEKFPAPDYPSLFPDGATPEDKANMRMIEEVIDTHYEAINWSLGEILWFHRAGNPETSPEATRLLSAAKDQTYQIHTYLSTHLTKPFFSGPSIGYADFAVAPVFNRSILNGIAPPPGSLLDEWYTRVKDVPAISETWAEVAEAAPKMKGLGPEAWKKGSGRRREYRDHRLEWMVKNGGIGIVLKGIEDGNVRFSWPWPGEGGKL